MKRHGLRCRWFGHNPRSECLPLNKRVLLAVGALNRDGLGASADAVAHVTGINNATVMRHLLAGLMVDGLVSPLSHLSDEQLVAGASGYRLGYENTQNSKPVES